MSIYADFDLLERAYRRKGSRIAEESVNAAPEWAASREAQKCLLHAALIQKHIERLPFGRNPPIHVPMRLYYCGIAWFCVMSLSDKAVPDL
ncbi:hypothetical protein N7450_005417 [Penicillium hetheringtonii]|uniref:Uncharacterized protein n=1 Tax=Penicillium hetheringtonii TaxID=911720 RepID=A0AAD6DIH9_9EURO|nr:hypothetical protein N7450_005417 [Penicillium hetheringtonii]